MSAPQATILIVDDEELNRDGLARRLQRHDYEVVAARSGREAIELLGGRQFDLVLLDIMMPGMNGLEVLKFLRRVDSLVDLPIIMVTAKGESEDMVEAFELGANDYVTKPLDIPVVLARVRTQLTLRRAVAQVKELERTLDNHNQELRARPWTLSPRTSGSPGTWRRPRGSNVRSCPPFRRKSLGSGSPGRSGHAVSSPWII
jgi:DNA-binding response OmpR family regulator